MTELAQPAETFFTLFRQNKVLWVELFLIVALSISTGILYVEDEKVWKGINVSVLTFVIIVFLLTIPIFWSKETINIRSRYIISDEMLETFNWAIWVCGFALLFAIGYLIVYHNALSYSVTVNNVSWDSCTDSTKKTDGHCDHHANTHMLAFEHARRAAT
jgi:uncharacterized membrane-anchored protein